MANPDPDQKVKIRRKSEIIEYREMDGFTFQFLMGSQAFELLMTELKPNTEMQEAFSHPGEEIHYVVEGKLEVRIDDQVYILAAGDSIWHDSNQPHLWRNPTDKPTRVCTAAWPRSYISLFLESMDKK